MSGQIDRVQLQVRMMAAMADAGGLYLRIRMQVRTKPLLGGVFGVGKFLVASHTQPEQGLDRVTYMVLEERTWLAVSLADSVPDALGQARRSLEWFDPLLLARFIGELAPKREAEQKQARADFLAHQKARIADAASTRPAPSRVIPKRRRQIFEKSDGKCHYCSVTLALDGKWHIEHKMPRALLGGSETSNLVASCVSCNHKKRDKTDLEFLAGKTA